MIKLGKAKVGTWVRLGWYGRAATMPVLWRVAGPIGDSSVRLVTAGVIDKAPFDGPSEVHPDGDNRWRDSSLRAWLNSSAPGNDPGFLHAFDARDVQALIEMEIETEVTTGYSAQRPPGIDRTRDRVWVLSWEEYKKLPKTLRGGARSEAFTRDHPEELIDNQIHWSRSPITRFGIALLEHWEPKKEHTNSGASCEFAIRPCIALAAGSPLEGEGTEEAPYERVSVH